MLFDSGLTNADENSSECFTKFDRASVIAVSCAFFVAASSMNKTSALNSALSCCISARAAPPTFNGTACSLMVAEYCVSTLFRFTKPKMPINTAIAIAMAKLINSFNEILRFFMMFSP